MRVEWRKTQRGEALLGGGKLRPSVPASQLKKEESNVTWLATVG
jgi:hypothetical protein